MSDLKPIRTRNGANTSGSETINETNSVETPSSTIITRLSVPFSSTIEIPVETWNSDSRNRRGSGNSVVAASANGRNRVPSRIQPFANVVDIRLIGEPSPVRGICRSRS